MSFDSNVSEIINNLKMFTKIKKIIALKNITVLNGLRYEYCMLYSTIYCLEKRSILL